MHSSVVLGPSRSLGRSTPVDITLMLEINTSGWSELSTLIIESAHWTHCLLMYIPKYVCIKIDSDWVAAVLSLCVTDCWQTHFLTWGNDSELLLITEPRWTPVVSICSGVASLKVFASIFPPVFYPAALRFMLLFSGVSSRRRLWALNKQQCRYWIIHWHRLTLKAKTVSASKLSQERPEENGVSASESVAMASEQWKNWTMKLFSLQDLKMMKTLFLRLFPFLKIQKLFIKTNIKHLPQNEPSQAASPLPCPQYMYWVCFTV